MQIARIKLSGRNPEQLNEICEEITGVAKKLGVNWRGPIPLPTKKLKVTTMKTPCGDGTGHGNASWDRWEMRIHKRVIDMPMDDRVLHNIMRVPIPREIDIEIEQIE